MTLTDILTAHQAEIMSETSYQQTQTGASCSGCDWHWWPKRKATEVECLDAHAAHVVEEMAAANIVAIELPEATEREDMFGRLVDDYLARGRSMLYAAPEGMVPREGEYVGPYLVQFMSGASGQHYSVDSARAYAAALLAAANAAAAASTPTPGETP